MMSCITPNGQMIEQYTRPKASVSSTRNTTTPTFSASTAGRNCILAVQPNQACSVPVKSRKNSVTAVKNRMASVSLIFA